MTVQVGLSQSWSETPRTGFLALRPITVDRISHAMAQACLAVNDSTKYIYRTTGEVKCKFDDNFNFSFPYYTIGIYALTSAGPRDVNASERT